MKKPLILLFLPFLFSCNFLHQEKSTSANEGNFDFLNDTLYKYINFKGTLKDAWLSAEDGNKYILLDSITTKLLLNNKKSPIISPYLHARYVAKQKMIGKIQPIIIYVSSDDYSSYMMVTLNEEKQPVEICEIAGGWFNEPHQIKDSIGERGGDTFCKVMDECNIDKYVTRFLFKCYTDSSGVFNILDVLAKDSLYYKIKIDKSGKIITTLIDSIRIPIVSEK